MNTLPFTIKVDDLRGPEIAELLAEHLRCMHEVTPLKSVHALDINRLRRPEITFWSVWSGEVLAGCGALKELDSGHGEVKSMRTVKTLLRQGVGGTMLQHIITEARRRGYRRLSLETGAFDYFHPAHALYRKFGFTLCGPFGNYDEDPNSVFMTMAL